MSSWRSKLTCYPFFRRIFVAGIVFSVLHGANVFAQEYTDITRYGTSNAFVRPGLVTGDDLKQAFREHRSDYEKVLQETNWPGNFDDLFSAVASGNFSEAKFPIGYTFDWQAIRKNGVAQPTDPVRWAGQAPFDGFEFRFESNGQRHHFVVPKACGNLSLVSMEPIPEPEIDLNALVPSLRIHAPNKCVGVNVTVDVMISDSMPEGATLDFTVTRPNGQSETLNPTTAGGSYRWQGPLEGDIGVYTFNAAVNTSAGKTRTASEQINIESCEPTCNLIVVPPAADPTPKAGRASMGIDLCKSSALTGALTSRTVMIYHTPLDGTEQLIETLSLSDACRTSYTLEEYGSYRFESEVKDDRGMSSSCEAEYTLVKPEGELLPFFTVFGGNERRWRSQKPGEDDPNFLYDRSAALVGGTIGIMYAMSDHFAVFGQGGVAPNLRDPENTSIFADVGANILFGRGYFGAGVGMIDFNHEHTRDSSFFVHGGFNLTDRLQLNIEGRAFMITHLDMIHDNFAYFAGIRYFWTK